MSDAAVENQTTTDNQSSFNVQRIYLKDLSLELPNAPAIFLEQGQPQVDIQLNLEAQALSAEVFEVTVMATITTKVNDKVAFLAEGKQAGIFDIVSLPAENLEPILSVVCPNIVFPYLRANLADAINRTGFPPVHLTEVNFEALYMQRLQQEQQAAGNIAKDGESPSGLILPPTSH